MNVLILDGILEFLNNIFQVMTANRKICPSCFLRMKIGNAGRWNSVFWKECPSAPVLYCTSVYCLTCPLALAGAASGPQWPPEPPWG